MTVRMERFAGCPNGPSSESCSERILFYAKATMSLFLEHPIGAAGVGS